MEAKSPETTVLCACERPENRLRGPNLRPHHRDIWRTCGRFFRKEESKWICRFRCRLCKRSLSQATFHPCARQRKRRLNPKIYKMACSGVSQRRMALLLKTTQTTVSRKLKFLAELARQRQEQWRQRTFTQARIAQFQFDEMETFEHTKLKPLSLPLVVICDRKILGNSVARMPAKGRLASLSVAKYGARDDERAACMVGLLRSVGQYLAHEVTVQSDCNPTYRGYLLQALAEKCTVRHLPTLATRGSVVGEAEVKDKRYDPLFALNHTAAMLRANLNRLVRRTWCTTKTLAGLQDHLDIYIDYHNRILTCAS